MKGHSLKEQISKVLYPVQFRSELLVCATPIYEDSFRAILEYSGRKSQIAKMLEQRLRYLDGQSPDQRCRSGWIEKLSYEKNMYSLIIKDKDLNIRILSVSYTHKGKKYLVLLKAFLEKNKAQSKTSSYKSEIELLRPTINHLEEMFQNGIQTD